MKDSFLKRERDIEVSVEKIDWRYIVAKNCLRLEGQ